MKLFTQFLNEYFSMGEATVKTDGVMRNAMVKKDFYEYTKGAFVKLKIDYFEERLWVNGTEFVPVFGLVPAM